MKALLALVLLSGATLWLVPAPSASPATLAVWLLGLLLLEGLAPRLPQLGKFQLATLWSWGWLVELQQPPLLAAWLVALWWCGRCSWASVSIEHGRRALLAEWAQALTLAPLFYAWRALLPLAPAELCTALSLCALAEGSALVLTEHGDEGARWLSQRLNATLRPLRLLAWLGTLGFLQAPFGARCCLLAFLLILQLGAANCIFRVQKDLDQEAYDEWLQTQEELRRSLEEGNLARRKLQATEEEKGFLERLSRTATLADAGALLARTLEVYLHPRSVVVLWSATGKSSELQPLAMLSPHAEQWQNLALSGLGAATFHEVLRDQIPRVLHVPLLKTEPRALVLPLPPQGLLYLGRQAAWTPSEESWIGALLGHVQGPIAGLWQNLSQSTELDKTVQQKEQLLGQVECQRLLLACAERFSHLLEPEVLWRTSVEWLQSLMLLEGAALGERGGGTVVAYGPTWHEVERICARVPAGSSHLYLTAPERAHWGLEPGPFSNLLALPLLWKERFWLIGFAGQQRLSSEQLQMLCELAHLLGANLARASLHQEVVLTHGRLVQSQELWLQTHKSLALAQMAASVAHELNSPLGAAYLALDAALASASEGQRKLLTRALEACKKSQTIIGRLGQLSAAKREGGESNDLVQVLRLLIEQLQPLEVTLTLVGPPHLILPVARISLDRLLLPLLQNALEAVRERPSGREVRIEWGSSEGEAWFEVADNGAGIPTELQSRVSEPFFTTKAVGKHLGLGLATVEQTCHQLGGRWRLESRAGGPTRVRVNFRL